MSHLTLSAEERQRNRLADATRETAVEQVRVQGYTVLEAVLPESLVSALHDSFIELLNKHTATHPPNRGPNRYQMHLPFRLPFSDERVINNPLAMPIIEAVLGEDCVCHYFASDTPLPGSEYQRVHSDIHPLFPESDVIVPPYGLVLNIPLVDFRQENGAVEIWPGATHWAPVPRDMEVSASSIPSQRVIMPAGSLLIRDLRMWHRGTPNCSAGPRPNMALIYARHWLRTRYPPIDIARRVFAEMSPRAQRLFRCENITEDEQEALA